MKGAASPRPASPHALGALAVLIGLAVDRPEWLQTFDADRYLKRRDRAARRSGASGAARTQAVTIVAGAARRTARPSGSLTEPSPRPVGGAS